MSGSGSSRSTNIYRPPSPRRRQRSRHSFYRQLYGLEPVAGSVAAGTKATGTGLPQNIQTIFQQLDAHEKQLISIVLKIPVRDCTPDSVSEFISLDAGVRELRIQQHISSCWTNSDWRNDVENFRKARRSLYSKCSLEAPTAQDKYDAIMDVKALTIVQKALVSSLYSIRPDQLTAEHVRLFGVWLISDPAHDQGRTVLENKFDDYCKLRSDYNPDVSVVPTQASKLWFEVASKDRLMHWRCNTTDLITFGSLVHKLRFDQESTLSEEEQAVANNILGRTLENTVEARQELAHILCMHTERLSSGEYIYPKETYALFLLTYPREGKRLCDSPYYHSLFVAAQRESEFNTLLDFFGVQTENAEGSLDLSSGQSVAKLDPAGMPNQYNGDSFSGAQVRLSDGRWIILDMVADGMGGQTAGENTGTSNAHDASDIAREIFDLAAMAGWIREPEDVRKLMVLVDLAIVIEQYDRKTQVDLTQENNMGTTMVVAFQRGKDLWLIHCGDSDGNVIRNGNVVFNTVPHSSEYTVKVELGKLARREITEEWKASGIDTGSLLPSAAARFELEVKRRASAMLHKYIQDCSTDGRPPFPKTQILSSLGLEPRYITINNTNTVPKPFVLQDLDTVALMSDGMSVPVCAHEIPLTLFGPCSGDIPAAVSHLIGMANGRRDPTPYNTICGCKSRVGHEDDTTLVLRHAAAGFHGTSVASNQRTFNWLDYCIREVPVQFGQSKYYRMMVARYAGQTTTQDDLSSVLEIMVSAADAAVGANSRHAHNIVVDFISNVLPQADSSGSGSDQAQLIFLASRIQNWSDLIMQILMQSSESKLILFELARRIVDTGSLKQLLAAKSHATALLAKEATGASDDEFRQARQQQEQSVSTPIFGYQTDLDDNPLPPHATRYLDRILVDLLDSTIVQDTARILRVRPRDLEIMLFYVYSIREVGLSTTTLIPKTKLQPDLEFALNPHLYPERGALINEITSHLQCADAERILRSAYLIWRIIGTKLTAEQISAALGRLEQYVNEMRSTQWDSGLMVSDPYAPRFRDLLATLKTRYGSQQ